MKKTILYTFLGLSLFGALIFSNGCKKDTECKCVITVKHLSDTNRIVKQCSVYVGKYSVSQTAFSDEAGQPGWACIVPIYNILVLLKVAGKPWWWILLMCIPIVNFVILIMVYHGISVNFGKDAGFTIGLILLPIIFIPILGFGKAQYIGTGVPQN
jgi:hypothetical protein